MFLTRSPMDGYHNHCLDGNYQLPREFYVCLLNRVKHFYAKCTLVEEGYKHICYKHKVPCKLHALTILVDIVYLKVLKPQQGILHPAYQEQHSLDKDPTNLPCISSSFPHNAKALYHRPTTLEATQQQSQRILCMVQLKSKALFLF